MNRLILPLVSRGFVAISALSLLYVSVMATLSPQMVMDLVQVKLTNNDAISSIRGVYGGVGLSVIAVLIYLLINDVKKGLVFLTLFWGSYAVSRILTILIDGSLGGFGNQWLTIEGIFFIVALTLSLVKKDNGKF